MTLLRRPPAKSLDTLLDRHFEWAMTWPQHGLTGKSPAGFLILMPTATALEVSLHLPDRAINLVMVTAWSGY
jgi:hypothetical protein